MIVNQATNDAEMAAADPHPGAGAGVNRCSECPWPAGDGLASLCASGIEELALYVTRRTINANQRIATDSQMGIYGVAAGTVAVTKYSDNGHLTHLRLVTAGGTFGQAEYFAGHKMPMEIRALSSACLCIISRDALERLLDRHLNLARRLLNSLARELCSVEEQLLELSLLSVRVRLARLLTRLLHSHGEERDGRWLIHLPLSRQEIALLLHTRPETVARSVSALVRDGIAHFKGRTVTIHDLAALRQESDAEQGRGAR